MKTDTVYTIVETGADADRGSFPSPFAVGSFRSLQRAKEDLDRLVEEKRKTLDGRCDKEERGEDSWEAYEDGYGAMCFSRIEILASTLDQEGPW